MATAAEALRTVKASTILVTLGEQGVLCAWGPKPFRETAIGVKAVDTSGAGDAFIGALAAFVVRPIPLREVVRRAMGVAALTVTRPGTQSSYPRFREAMKFLRQRGLMNP